jgi:hypothetical protein
MADTSSNVCPFIGKILTSFRPNGHLLSALQRSRLEQTLNEIHELNIVEKMEEVIGRQIRESEFATRKLFTVVRLISEKAGELSIFVLPSTFSN